MTPTPAIQQHCRKVGLPIEVSEKMLVSPEKTPEVKRAIGALSSYYKKAEGKWDMLGWPFKVNVPVLLAYVSNLEAAHKAQPVADVRGMVEASQFLLDRLDEFSDENLSEEGCRQWNGHILPAFTRLKGALASARHAMGGEEKA